MTRISPSPLPKATVSRASAKSGWTDALSTMLSVWEEVLGRDAVAPDTDLFEDGVDSVEVVRLLAAIERRYRFRPDLGLVLANPTPLGLLLLLEQERGRRRPRPLCVPLRLTGSPAAVHVVSGVDGHGAIPDATRLCGSAPSGPSVYAYRSPGLDGARALRTVTGQARALHRAYGDQGGDCAAAAVVGYSTGGCVAMELARCLGRDGRAVGLVVVEGALPTGDAPGLSFGEELEAHLRLLATRGGVRMEPGADGASGVRQLLAVREPGAGPASVREYLRLQRVFVANRRAWLRFRPRPVDCPMVLVIREAKPKRAALMRARWGPYVRGPIRTIWSPAHTHDDVIRDGTWFAAACELAASLIE